MRQPPLSIRCSDAWDYIVFFQCQWLKDKPYFSNVILSEFIEIESEISREQAFKRADYIKALQQKVDNKNNKIIKK